MLVYLFVCGNLYASLPFPEQSPIYKFIDLVFLQDNEEKDVLDLYRKVKRELEEPIERAYLEYYLARYYQAIRDLETMKNYDTAMINGKVFGIYKNFVRRDAAIKIYDRVYETTEKELKGVKNPAKSPWYLLQTRIIAELCLLKGNMYMMGNGLEVPKRAKNLLKANPNCLRSQLILVNQCVFAGEAWGGDGNEAIRLLQKMDITACRDKELLLDYYNNFAYAYGRVDNYEQANKYIQKALKVYPSNLQANFIWSKIQSKGF